MPLISATFAVLTTTSDIQNDLPDIEDDLMIRRSLRPLSVRPPPLQLAPTGARATKLLQCSHFAQRGSDSRLRRRVSPSFDIVPIAIADADYLDEKGGCVPSNPQTGSLLFPGRNCSIPRACFSIRLYPIQLRAISGTPTTETVVPMRSQST